MRSFQLIEDLLSTHVDYPLLGVAKAPGVFGQNDSALRVEALPGETL
jgi:hypothetical protein